MPCRGTRSDLFFKKVVLNNYSKFTGNKCVQEPFFNTVSNFSQGEAPAQVFFCEFCKVFRNFFVEHLRLVAPSHKQVFMQNSVVKKGPIVN